MTVNLVIYTADILWGKGLICHIVNLGKKNVYANQKHGLSDKKILGLANKSRYIWKVI